MAFTETLLKEYNHETYGITGYNAVHNYRTMKIGGAVALYVKDCIDFNVRHDLFNSSEHIEPAFIEIDKDCVGTNSNVIIGVIYRPPDTDISLFNESLCNILSGLQIKNKLCYQLGDYNLNLLNTDSHTLTGEFVDIMYSYSLLSNITRPTRERSTTLIDNIFSNDLLSKDATISGLLDTDITDHFPVVHVVFSSKVNINRHRSTFRSINSENIDKFLNEISHHDSTPVVQSSGAQESFSIFHASFLQIYNRCFPFRSQSAYTCNKHWLSESLKSQRKEQAI